MQRGAGYSDERAWSCAENSLLLRALRGVTGESSNFRLAVGCQWDVSTTICWNLLCSLTESLETGVFWGTCSEVWLRVSLVGPSMIAVVVV